MLYPQAFPVREVSCQSPFTFTDEGTECQPARAVLGLLLWEDVASSPGACTCGLRTTSLKHLWSLAEAELAQDLCNALENVVHSPRETSQSGLPPSLST